MHNSLILYYERGNAILEIISYPLVNLKVKYVTSLIQNINSASPNVKTSSLPLKFSIQGLFLGMYFPLVQ